MNFDETKELRMERHALVMGAGVVCTRYTICETLRYIYPFVFCLSNCWTESGSSPYGHLFSNVVG